MAEKELPDAPWATPAPAPEMNQELQDAPWALQKVAFTPGQKQQVADEALAAKYQGVIPDEAKIAAKNFANTLALNAPRAGYAYYRHLTENIPWSQAVEEERAYDEALSRLNPKASMTGTGLGIAGSFLVPGAALGTAAKAGSLAGRALEAGAISGGLSGVSGYLGTADPHEALKDAALGAGIGAVAAPVLGALGNYFTKVPAVAVTENGVAKLTPEAERATIDAFQGKLNPEDIKSFQDHLVNAYTAQGGASKAGANEALLKSLDVEPTRSIVTGKAAPEAAKDIAENARAAGLETLGKKAEGLIGEAPDRTAIAEALASKGSSEQVAAGERYSDLNKLGGTSLERQGPPVEGMRELPSYYKYPITETFQPNIEAALRDRNVPVNLEATGKDSYVQTKAALAWMQSNPMMGIFPHGGGLTPQNMSEIMKTLNDFRKKASGSDYNGINAIKQGFLNSLTDNLTKETMFSGNADEILKSLKEAPEVYSAFKRTWMPTEGAGAKEFNRTVQNLVDEATFRIGKNPNQGMLDTTQSMIDSFAISPRVGSAYYERMEAALGAGSPAMENFKQLIKTKALDTGGDLSQLPKKIDSFLKNSPTLAQKVFDNDPGKLSELRRLSEGLKIINAKPISQEEKTSALATLMGKFTKLTTGAGLGYLFHGIPGVLEGMIASKAAETVSEPIARHMARRAETVGAPSVTKGYVPRSARLLNEAPYNPYIGGNVQAVAPVGVPGYQEPTTLPARPVARATGGRVAAKLMADVERAKKDVNNRTKSLLNADDSHVAKALEIANQNVEG